MSDTDGERCGLFSPIRRARNETLGETTGGKARPLVDQEGNREQLDVGVDEVHRLNAVIGSVIEKLHATRKRMCSRRGPSARFAGGAAVLLLRLGARFLLGDRTRSKRRRKQLNVSLGEGVRIINPDESEELDNFAHRFELRRRLQRDKGTRGGERR